MRTRLAISVCVSAALLLAGCGADSVEGAAQAGESAAVSSPTTKTSSAPDVCSGKQDCVSLAVVDVDGDSKDDSIGSAGGQIVVLTASGIEAAVGRHGLQVADRSEGTGCGRVCRSVGR